MPRFGPPSLGNLQIRGKLILAFLSLSLLIAVCGASGLFLVHRIGTSVSVFSDVTSPMLGHALNLVENAQQMRVVSLNAVSGSGQDETALKQLGDLDATARQSIEALHQLATNAGLTVDIADISNRQQGFGQSLQAILAVHARDQAAKAKTVTLMDAFVAARRGFDDKLAKLAGDAEIEIVESEDRAKVSLQTGQATVDSLGGVIAQTLTETFPLLQGFNKLMRDTIKLQEATTSYLNTAGPEDLDAIQKRAQSIFKTAAAATKRVAGRLRTEAGKQQVAALTDGLGKLEQMLLSDGGLFAAQREANAIGAEAATMQRQAAAREADYVSTLEDSRRIVGQRNDIAKQSAESSVSQALPIIGIIVILGIGAALIISALCANNIVVPIRRLTGVMTRLADGALDTQNPDRERRDEIGAMARTVDVFRLDAVDRERLAATVLETRISELMRQQALRDDLVVFKGAILANLDSLIGEVGGLRMASRSLLHAAEQGGAEANISATACNSAASSALAVAAATEQLNASIREISQQANHTSAIVGEATQKTQTTDQQVGQLTVAVRKIDSVVSLIRSIARQTSLLALNATIESARAGEAGRGFAVVAAEVKALSEQTAKATEEIAQQIQMVQTTTDAAAAAIGEIGAKVGDIHALTASVAAAVAEQQAATADIARNVHFAAASTDEAAQSSRNVIDVSEETGTQAKSIESVSDRLQGVSAAVSKAVHEFIDAISSDLGERQVAIRLTTGNLITIRKNNRSFEVRAGDVSLTGVQVAAVEDLQMNDLVTVDLGFVKADAKVVLVNSEVCDLEFTIPLTKAQPGDPRWMGEKSAKIAA